MTEKMLSGEYEQRGEYHRSLNKNWKYYPVYVEKMAFVDEYLNQHAAGGRTIDLGCGEGILVERFQACGFDMIGLDYNYEAQHVVKGDITNIQFGEASFDLVTALDVIEHLSFAQQELALQEIHRILKPGGKALISIPNLSHFASRVTFALTGKLLRTSTIDRHQGDRPRGEYVKLFRNANLQLNWEKGIFPTYPLISVLTYLSPGKSVWLHRIYNRLLAVPGYCFLNIFEVQKLSTLPAAAPRRAA